jgi:hypothetical protein
MMFPTSSSKAGQPVAMIRSTSHNLTGLLISLAFLKKI